jgi:hypothetical protein
VFVIVVFLGGALVAPVVVPLLSAERLEAYLQRLGQRPQVSEKKVMGPLPHHFADRFGWEEMAKTVASVYESLSPEERKGVIILTANYGEASALRYHGRGLGLPPAVSQHNNYYLWGPGPGTGEVVITVGIAPSSVRDAFESVEIGPRLHAPYAMPYETEQPVLICRKLKWPVAEAWRRRGRSYI